MREDYRSEEWIGKRFGRLTIIAFEKIPRKQYTSTHWIARCDCGTLKSVDPQKVLSGNTRSCGCLKAERAAESNRVNKVKHGGRKERLYSVWHNMKQRCYGTTYKDYPNWGGRGICICDEWRDDFAAFRSWATENGYADGLSLDRIDVNGNYEPTNCRWVDWSTQAKNKTTSINFEINGELLNLVEIAEKYGIKYGTLYQRIRCYHWSIEKAISVPVRDNAIPNKEWREKYGS